MVAVHNSCLPTCSFLREGGWQDITILTIQSRVPNCSVDNVSLALPYPGERCLTCMENVKAKDVAAGSIMDNRYACTDYCQDPALVLTSEQCSWAVMPAAHAKSILSILRCLDHASSLRAALQGDACSTCVNDEQVTDPWACQNW
jgi:hypothetical protein